MKNLNRVSYLSACAALVSLGFVSGGIAQDHQRITKTVSSQPINQPLTGLDKTKSLSSSAPSNQYISGPATEIAAAEQNKPLVMKTSSSTPLNVVTAAAAGKMVYSTSLSTEIIRGIQSKLGIPYRYGSSGPNRYDCSGFVWSVFRDAGVEYTRGSARSLWASGLPVSGDERFKFGTLVFLNGLGHIGIVADENGFYHASSSKGVTYSPFKGYWEKRIVGFRRLNVSAPIAVR